MFKGSQCVFVHQKLWDVQDEFAIKSSNIKLERREQIRNKVFGSTLLQVYRKSREQNISKLFGLNPAIGKEKTKNRKETIYVGSTLLQVQKGQRVEQNLYVGSTLLQVQKGQKLECIEPRYVGSALLQVQKGQRVEQNLYMWVQPCSRYRKGREENKTKICGFNPAQGTEKLESRIEHIYVGSTLLKVKKRQRVEVKYVGSTKLQVQKRQRVKQN